MQQRNITDKYYFVDWKLNKMCDCKLNVTSRLSFGLSSICKEKNENGSLTCTEIFIIKSTAFDTCKRKCKICIFELRNRNLIGRKTIAVLAMN